MLDRVWRTCERLLRRDKSQDSFPARQLFVLGTSFLSWVSIHVALALSIPANRLLMREIQRYVESASP